jgi:hypothetical protein
MLNPSALETLVSIAFGFSTRYSLGAFDIVSDVAITSVNLLGSFSERTALLTRPGPSAAFSQIAGQFLIGVRLEEVPHCLMGRRSLRCA